MESNQKQLLLQSFGLAHFVAPTFSSAFGQMPTEARRYMRKTVDYLLLAEAM